MSLSKSKSTKALLKIGQASKILGVSIDTLRRWEKVGKIKAKRTAGGTRLYSLPELKKISSKSIKIDQNIPISTEELLKKTQNTQKTGISEYRTEQSSEQIFRQSDISDLSNILSPSGSSGQKKTSFLTKFLLPSAVILTITTLAVTSWITTSYLVDPLETAKFFKNSQASFLKPFDKLAKKIVTVISPTQTELKIISQLNNLKSAVLAATSASRFLEINSDTQINGSLFVRDNINNLQLESTPSAGTISLSSGPTTLEITKSAKLDQDVSTVASPTFNTLNLAASNNQLIFQSGGPTGTLTWTPTATRTITLPDATTTLIGTDTTQTLTNKTISGSSNT
ncbi:MerR family DNA-binding transcriptional regulator, partial [Candidatus Daviesbacteria bacterium]|nr:MerR family DNA-binding transcriptional regulator [Candidatus Daviesbacteria bacterium]